MCISHIYFFGYYLTLANLKAMNSAQPSAILNDGKSDSNVTLPKTLAVQEDKDITANGSC